MFGTGFSRMRTAIEGGASPAPRRRLAFHEGVAALLPELAQVRRVEGEQAALGEALVVDAAGVLALGVGAEERARKRILQQAPQRLHSPWRRASSGSVSSRRTLAWMKRRTFPLTCSAMRAQSAIAPFLPSSLDQRPRF